LNLDSLARVQLQSELEQRLGVSISDQEFERIATFGALRARLGLGAALPASGPNGEGFRPADAVPLLTSTDQASAFIYPRWTWSPPLQALRVMFQEGVMRPLVWLLAAPSVFGGQSKPPSQPLLLIANHVTAYDAPLVLYALPAAMRRRVAIAMSGEMLEDWRHARNQGNWFLNLLAPVAYVLVTALFNVFPLPRSAGFRRSFDHAGQAMDRGYHVLVFPEGRRSSDGVLQSFRPGIGLLARDSKAAILPVAIQGLGELKQRKRSWFRSGTMQIHVGEPLLPYLQLAPEKLAEVLHDALAALLQSSPSES
jgi:long-chain acyl-CoA synthetase